MKEPEIIEIHKDRSIPWFEQIKKTVKYPDHPEHEVYYSLKPPDYVTALTHTSDGRFIVLRQYRPAVEDYTYEVPSGHVDPGETPAQAMLRELKEETACETGDLVLLGVLIPDTGRLENRLWAFYAYNVQINSIPDQAESEGIQVILITREELFQMIHEGKFNHALDLSVIALAILRGYLKI